MQLLIKAGTPVVTIFGKSWDFHVSDVLRVTPEENLDMIADTIAYFKSKGIEVIFDAEHYFDGYRDNPAYALKTLSAARQAGADVLCLCDTNSASMTSQVREIVRETRAKINAPLAIHVHNDSGLAVANSVVAVQEGVEQVQGTVNGLGERCGNADLCVVIPNLKLKLGIDCISDANLKKMSSLASYVNELGNLPQQTHQPYVGQSAFTHKGGMHVDAVKKNPRTYEHVEPELVGNQRRVLISELSGSGNIIYKAKEFGIDLSKESPETRPILENIKAKEHAGYQYDGAEASFELLIHKALKTHRTFFELEGFSVIVENRYGRVITEATIKIKVKGKFEHTAAEGNGPVNALDSALRKSLEVFYPSLKNVRLTDFRVRVLTAATGTSAKVRVIIEWTDGKRVWSTVGVSENIIEASWEALVDGIEYKLLKDNTR